MGVWGLNFVKFRFQSSKKHEERLILAAKTSFRASKCIVAIKI